MLLSILLLIVIIVLMIYNKTNIHYIYGKISKNNIDIKTGLMYRKNKLKHNEGMLFLMKDTYNSMWMKNTYIPLDIIFLHDMVVVGYIQDTVPLSEKSLSINKKSNAVLEMNAGSIQNYNILIGDIIEFIEY